MSSRDNPEKPLWISFRRCDQLDVNAVFDAVDKVVQSNAKFFMDFLRIRLHKVKLPSGSGRFFTKYITGQTNPAEFAKKKS